VYIFPLGLERPEYMGKFRATDKIEAGRTIWKNNFDVSVVHGVKVRLRDIPVVGTG
jgi:hypothetical protein